MNVTRRSFERQGSRQFLVLSGTCCLIDVRASMPKPKKLTAHYSSWSESIPRPNLHPHDSTDQGNEGGEAERSAPPPLLGEPWRECRRNGPAKIGAHIHKA